MLRSPRFHASVGGATRIMAKVKHRVTIRKAKGILTDREKFMRGCMAIVGGLVLFFAFLLIYSLFFSPE